MRAAEEWTDQRDGGIDIWTIEAASTIDHDEQLLSPDEVSRATRFASATRRAQFAGARAALRTILARYLGAHPLDVAFSYSANGKPYLSRTPGLAFNLSHTDGLSAIAVGRDIQVGIDVEALRDSPEFEGLARNHFAPSEAATIAGLPKPLRTKAFLTVWTRKEALAKAADEGIAATLDTPLPIGDLPAGHRIAYQPAGSAAPRDWFVYSPTMPGFAVSLVLSGPAARCSVHRFAPNAAPHRPG